MNQKQIINRGEAAVERRDSLSHYPPAKTGEDLADAIALRLWQEAHRLCQLEISAALAETDKINPAREWACRGGYMAAATGEPDLWVAYLRDSAFRRKTPALPAGYP